MNHEKEIHYIDLQEIFPHEGNRRVGGTDPEKLNQLAQSIKAIGIQQPAIIRPHPDKPGKFEIVAGERRFEASKLAQCSTLPCIIRDVDDITLLKIHTIENLQREDIHPLDEAYLYQQLLDKAGYDVEMIAHDIGKSKVYVYQRLKLQELIKEAYEAFAKDEIILGHALLISRLSPVDQKKALEYLTRNSSIHVGTEYLKDFIESQIMLDLKKAPFKKDDKTLLETGIICTTCPKRTGFSPELFPEIGSDDLCTDSQCFNAKLNTLLDRKLDELEGEDFLKLAGNDTYNEPEPPGAVKRYEWFECKKKDGGKKSVIVSGSERGRLLYAHKSGGGSYSMQTTPEEKAERRIENLKNKMEIEIRHETWNKTMIELDKNLRMNKAFRDDFLQLITSRMWSRLWEDYRIKLCKIHDWMRPPKENYENTWDRPSLSAVGHEKIKEMDNDALFLFMIEMTIIADLETNIYPLQDGEKNALDNFANLMKVDKEEIQARIGKPYDEKIKKIEKKETVTKAG